LEQTSAPPESNHVTLRTRLIVRQSCAPPRVGRGLHLLRPEATTLPSETSMN
jgi:hypothetical protein